MYEGLHFTASIQIATEDIRIKLTNRYRNYQTSGRTYESDYLSGNDGALQVTYTTTTTCIKNYY